METARNCKLAVLAGFDGVEVHACHHYLVDMFRDPRFNKRTDEYGGSADNRNRFPLELTEAVLKSVKEERPDMVVGIRIGCDTIAARPWEDQVGYTFEETKVFAKQLEDIGVDFIHVNLVRVGEGLLNRIFCYGVENHPAALFGFNLECLDQMPGNGLSFTVHIAGEVNFFSFLGRLFQRGNSFLSGGHNLVCGLKSVIDIDRKRFLW